MAPAVVTVRIAAVAVCLVVMVGAFAACRGEQRTSLVTVMENGVTLGSVTRQQAVSDVSGRVRFDVRLPTFVPDGGFVLRSVEAQLPNPVEFFGQDQKSNARAITTWASGTGEDETAIAIGQVARPIEIPQGEPVESGQDGAAAFVLREPDGISIAWNTAEEGFQLVALGPDLPSEEDLLRMLRSLR